VAALAVVVEVPGESACDIPRARVVALDQVAVIGVHDADKLGEARGGARMQGAP
jgi:hypothetical protein